MPRSRTETLISTSHFLSIMSEKGGCHVSSSSSSISSQNEAADFITEHKEELCGDCENDFVATTCPVSKTPQCFDSQRSKKSSDNDIEHCCCAGKEKQAQRPEQEQRSKEGSPFDRNQNKSTHVLRYHNSDKKNVILSYWDLPKRLKNSSSNNNISKFAPAP